MISDDVIRWTFVGIPDVEKISIFFDGMAEISKLNDEIAICLCRGFDELLHPLLNIRHQVLMRIGNYPKSDAFLLPYPGEIGNT